MSALFGVRRRWLCVCAFAALLAPMARAAPSAQVPRAPGRVRFWEDWTDLTALAERAPDSARSEVARRLALDPMDLTALVARSRWIAADSAAADSALAHADTADFGANVTLGTLLVDRGTASQWRAAWERVRAQQVGRGRGAEAARSAFFEALSARDSRDPTEPAIALAESLARSAGDLELVIAARTLAGTRWLQRDARRGLAMLLLATRLIPESGPCSMGAEAERQLGLTYKTLGRLDSARVHYQRAVAVAREVARPELSARCLHSLGTTLEAQGRSPEAEQVYRDALAMTPEYSVRLRANILGQLGKLMVALQRYDEAIAWFEQSNAIYERSWPRAEGRILNLQHLGQIETRRGAYDDARRHFERALTDARAFGLTRDEGAILSDFAALSMETGDDARASQQLDDALAAERRLGRERYVGMLLCTRAAILLEQGRPEAALREAREAAGRLAAAEPASLPVAQRSIVRALLATNQRAEAAAVADSAWAWAAAHADSALLVHAWVIRAEVDLAAGRGGPALDTLEHALPLARRMGARDLVLRVLERLGDALLATHRPAEAVPVFEEAIELQELARLSLASREERTQSQDVWQELYVRLALAEIRCGRGAAAFQVLDRSRARGLRETLAEELPAPRRGLPVAAVQSEVQARLALENAQRRLLAESALAPGDRSASLAVLQRRCGVLRERYDDARLRLERAAPDYARAAGASRALTVAAVRRRLHPGQTLLAYLVGQDATAIFAVSTSGFVAREIPWGESRLGREVDSLVAALTRGGDEAWREPARRLANVLLPGAALEGHGTLFVAPDGPLHALPFEVLRVADPATGEGCLVQRRAVVLGASPTLLFAEARSSRPDSGPIAAFGDPSVMGLAAGAMQRSADAPELAVTPLPSARREVRGIAERFPGARVYVGAAATEAQVVRELRRCRVLHVAAHGFVDSRHPRHSGLVLAREPGSEDDGLLQAWEVLEQRGDLDLVTLSSCETGVGTVRRGEGLLGLARAFRIAGAHNLVVSLWPVDDDATADFMLSFYDRLAAGDAPAEALAAAKRAMLAGHQASPVAGPARGITRTTLPAIRRHPAYWAAFVLHGEAGPPAGAATTH